MCLLVPPRLGAVVPNHHCVEADRGDAERPQTVEADGSILSERALDVCLSRSDRQTAVVVRSGIGGSTMRLRERRGWTHSALTRCGTFSSGCDQQQGKSQFVHFGLP